MNRKLPLLACCLVAVSAPLYAANSPATPAPTATPAPATAAPAPISKTTHDEALALVQVVLGPKLPEISRSLTNSFMAGLQQHHPDIKADTYEAVRQQVVKVVDDPATMQGLEERLVPVFAKTFSDDEMRQIMAFSKTSAGAKLFGGLPPPADVSNAMRGWAIGTLAPQLNQAVSDTLQKAGITP
jgi:hypothetical protein